MTELQITIDLQNQKPNNLFSNTSTFTMIRRSFFVIIASTLFFMSCNTSSEESSSGEAVEGSVATTESAWQELGPDQWRRYAGEGLPEAWQVSDEGTLHFAGEGEGGDIVTLEQYEDFELELEWKVSPGGNSGIMFRVSEDHDAPWRTGPEYQILDNEAHADAQEGADRHAGANYDMHAPSSDVVHPAGEWNQARIVVDGANVEHWLNGEKIVSYELWSEAWNDLIAESKWIDMKDTYGMNRVGHICLQDHGDPVWFRNIRIRSLSTLDI